MILSNDQRTRPLNRACVTEQIATVFDLPREAVAILQAPPIRGLTLNRRADPRAIGSNSSSAASISPTRVPDLQLGQLSYEAY